MPIRMVDGYDSGGSPDFEWGEKMKPLKYDNTLAKAVAMNTARVLRSGMDNRASMTLILPEGTFQISPIIGYGDLWMVVASPREDEDE